MTVLVTDNGTPNLTTSRAFRITVGEMGTSFVRSMQIGIPGVDSNTLNFSGIPDSTYVTQFAINLPGPWFNLTTNIANTNGLWSVIDPSATNSSRFYRALWSAGP